MRVSAVARMRFIIIHRFARVLRPADNAFKMLEHQVEIKGIRVIKVDVMSGLEWHIAEVAIIRILCNADSILRSGCSGDCFVPPSFLPDPVPPADTEIMDPPYFKPKTRAKRSSMLRTDSVDGVPDSLPSGFRRERAPVISGPSISTRTTDRNVTYYSCLTFGARSITMALHQEFFYILQTPHPSDTRYSTQPGEEEFFCLGLAGGNNPRGLEACRELAVSECNSRYEEFLNSFFKLRDSIDIGLFREALIQEKVCIGIVQCSWHLRLSQSAVLRFLGCRSESQIEEVQYSLRRKYFLPGHLHWRLQITID